MSTIEKGTAMIQLIVGQQAPAPFWPLPGAEGARFEQLDTGEWFIIIYMGQPSKEERQIVRKAKILTRYLIDETKSMVMAFIHLQSSPIIYELVFDPTKYQALEWKDRIDWWDKSNTVSLLLIDSTTGIIGAIELPEIDEPETRKNVEALMVNVLVAYPPEVVLAALKDSVRLVKSFYTQTHNGFRLARGSGKRSIVTIADLYGFALAAGFCFDFLTVAKHETRQRVAIGVMAPTVLDCRRHHGGLSLYEHNTICTQHGGKMARQKTSTFEDAIIVVSKLPWWAGLILALVTYLILHAIASHTPSPIVGPQQMGDVMAKTFVSSLAMFGQYVLPIAFVFGALLSAITASRQKRIYDSVASRPGTAALNQMRWQDFERLVSEYFRRNGFQVTRLGDDGPDGGIDLVMRLKSETYLVQCKQWKAYKVGAQPVREFYGVMTSQGAAGGYFVTSGVYTDEAKAFAKGLNLVLVDGPKLREMIDVASKGTPFVATKESQLSNAAPLCPKCGSAMKKRVARQGTNAGKEFWGCVSYPKCKGIRPIGETNG